MVEIVYDYDDLARLSEHDRSVIMRHLIELNSEDPLTDEVNQRRRRRFLILLTGSCVWLVPWIVYLGFSLPYSYDAGAWQVAWVGFDVMLLTALSATTYLIWRKRQMAILTAVITGTLLICDAWFDLTLSAGGPDFAAAVVTAVLGELPLAVLMFVFVGRLLFLTIRMAWTNFGHEGKMPHFWQLRMFTLSDPASWPKRARNRDSGSESAGVT